MELIIIYVIFTSSFITGHLISDYIEKYDERPKLSIILGFIFIGIVVGWFMCPVVLGAYISQNN